MEDVTRTLVREPGITALVDGAFCDFGHWCNAPAHMIAYHFEVDDIEVRGSACGGHSEDEWLGLVGQHVAALRAK